MEFSIIVSEIAKKDYNQIIDYILNTLDNEKAATNFANEIDRRLIILAGQPTMYPLSGNNHLHARGYRKCVINNYIMFYKVIEEKHELFIARILYGRVDYARYL